MHIGLIGGIGPAATVVYYQRLTALMRERESALDLTIVQASADELVANNTSDRREDQAEIFAQLIDRLAAAGADCAAITSLGGHFCFEETQRRSVLPLVSGVAPLDDYFAEQGIQTVGLLGTASVMRSGLYGQLRATRAVAPQAELQQVADTYVNMAITGTCSAAARRLFIEAGAQMVRDQGADAVVLAGTDLGLAFDGQDTGYKVIDALDVHVAVLADIASGARSAS